MTTPWKPAASPANKDVTYANDAKLSPGIALHLIWFRQAEENAPASWAVMPDRVRQKRLRKYVTWRPKLLDK